MDNTCVQISTEHLNLGVSSVFSGDGVGGSGIAVHSFDVGWACAHCAVIYTDIRVCVCVFIWLSLYGLVNGKYVHKRVCHLIFRGTADLCRIWVYHWSGDWRRRRRRRIKNHAPHRTHSFPVTKCGQWAHYKVKKQMMRIASPIACSMLI